MPFLQNVNISKTLLFICSFWGTALSFPVHPKVGISYLITTPTSSFRLFSNDDDDENDKVSNNDDDEDDEVTQTAYGNRSLAWTNRYRKLISYENVRLQAMALGLRSKEDWEELIQDGKCLRGPYMISRPDEMYQEEWVSWEEFLGVMRPYEDTKQIVQSVLKLKNMEDYKKFVKSDVKRAEGLRIPAKPDIVYKDKGWKGPEVFFGQQS
jgi:hypothetical protein